MRKHPDNVKQCINDAWLPKAHKILAEERVRILCRSGAYPDRMTITERKLYERAVIAEREYTLWKVERRKAGYRHEYSEDDFAYENEPPTEDRMEVTE